MKFWKCPSLGRASLLLKSKFDWGYQHSLRHSAVFHKEEMFILPRRRDRHKWYICTAGEWDRDWYRDQMESLVSCRNVHTDLRQVQGPGPIVSYCTSPVPCTCPCSLPCGVNRPTDQDKRRYRYISTEPSGNMCCCLSVEYEHLYTIYTTHLYLSLYRSWVSGSVNTP